MSRRFETLTNHTTNLIRLSYWTKVGYSTQTKTVDIASSTTLNVPTDDILGEFFVEAENYQQLMKFRTDPAYGGEWMWSYDDNFEFSFKAETRDIIVKNIQ